MYEKPIHNFGDIDRQAILADRLDAANKRIKELEALIKHERHRTIDAEDRLIYLGRLSDRRNV